MTLTSGACTAVAPVTFPRVLRAEWIKLWSLRSTYWAVAGALAAMVLVSLLMAVASVVDAEAAAEPAVPAFGFGYTFAQVVVGVLGALLVTGEYATGSVRSTLAAVPRRTPVLAAKAVLVALVGLAVGVVGTGLSFLASLALTDGAADLGDPEVLRVFWGTGLYLAAVGLLGLGIGALVRSTAAAVTVVLVVLLLLTTLVQLLMLWSDAFGAVYTYLPSVAGERIVLPVSGATAPGAPEALAPWAGFGVLGAYVAVTLAAAFVLLRRRDA